MKLTKEVPLSATEEAYLAQVMAGHAAAVQSADAKRAELVGVLLKDKGIPADTLVRTKAREGDRPAYLVYDVVEGWSAEKYPPFRAGPPVGRKTVPKTPKQSRRRR